MAYSFELDVFCDNNKCNKSFDKDDAFYCAGCYEALEERANDLEDELTDAQEEVARLLKVIEKLEEVK